MHLVYNPYMLLPLFAMLMAVFLWIRGWRYHSSRMGKTYLVLMGVLASLLTSSLPAWEAASVPPRGSLSISAGP